VWAKGDILEPVPRYQTVLQRESHLQQLMLEVGLDSLELLNEKPLSTTLHLANNNFINKTTKINPFIGSSSDDYKFFIYCCCCHFIKLWQIQISLTSMLEIKLQDYFNLYQKCCDNLRSHMTETGRDLWQKYCFEATRKVIKHEGVRHVQYE
jgi:hypothetical protein